LKRQGGGRPQEEPRCEEDHEPAPSIDTEAIAMVLKQDLYSSLRSFLEANVEDPRL
jgi:hypothetical protein